MNKILDMHTHLAGVSEGNTEKAIRELKLRRAQGIASFFSTGTVQEWRRMQEIRRAFRESEGCCREMQRGTREFSDFCREAFWISFGIHPWYSDQTLSEEERETQRQAYRACDAVGEIGMDSVWCQIPLSIQRKVLEEQLQTAADLQKPIVLHTKGQEKEIADMIRDFPGKVCVHWYSGSIEVLEKYLEMDCYFTLGPDLGENTLPEMAGTKLYEWMVGQIPANRLFLETDGTDAVAWAKGLATVEPEVIGDVLKKNLAFLARKKEMKEEELQKLMEENLRKFLNAEADHPRQSCII